MDEEKFKKIEYWINAELKHKGGPIPIKYFLGFAYTFNITKNKLEDIIDKILWEGRMYEPYPGLIDRVPLVYPRKKRRVRT